MISTKDLLKFEWPPKMPSYSPKERKRYKHIVVVTSVVNPKVYNRLEFTSEKKARSAMRGILDSTNVDIVADYEPIEMRNMDNGFLA
jgi:hypothetical protein